LEFWGDVIEWPPLWDSWQINYDSNADLNEVQKLEYLKQCLKGQALETVKHLVLIGSNYQIAMDTLEKKYADKRKIIARHFDAIVAIPSIRTESAAQLRKMSETFSVNLLGLKNQGIVCDDPFIAYIYESRLDETTRRHYESSLTNPKKVQTFKTLVDFVESRVVVLDNSSARSSLEGRGRHVNKNSNVGRTEERESQNLTFKEFQSRERGYHNDVQDGIVKMMAAATEHQSRALGRGRGKGGRATTPSTKRDPYRLRSVTPGDSRYGNNFRVGGGRGGGGRRERDQSQSRDQSAHRVQIHEPVPPCSYCETAGHRANYCPEFKKLTAKQRNEVATTRRMCFNCLDLGHRVPDCPSGYSCFTCKKSHHTLLHGAVTSAVTNQTSKVTIHSTTPEKQTVVLATAQVPILDYDEDVVCYRGMFDSGSQSTFITEKAFRGIKPKRHNCDIRVTGLGAQKSQRVNGFAKLVIKCGEELIEVDALIMPTLTQILPNAEIDTRLFNFMDELHLADPAFAIPAPIDILLGADVYYQLMSPGNVIERDGCTLVQTKLGWVPTGKIDQPGDRSSSYLGLKTTAGGSEVQEDIEKYWLTEEIPPPKSDIPILNPNLQSVDEKFAEKHYLDTTTEDESGRKVVELPFRKNSPVLGLSEPQARKRLMNLVSSFRKTAGKQEEYTKAFMDFFVRNHMELVPAEELAIHAKDSFYIPHHCVVKQESTTTKMRIVFDGSAVTTSGESLNSLLVVGPKRQDNLTNILIRFRFHLVALTGDVEKMYRQVALQKHDKDFHGILWTDDVNTPVQTYRMTRVTYGIGSSSHQAIHALQDSAAHAPDIQTSNCIRLDFYVDDLISGANSIAEARVLIRNVIHTG
jgi:hypothetical protein